MVYFLCRLWIDNYIALYILAEINGTRTCNHIAVYYCITLYYMLLSHPTPVRKSFQKEIRKIKNTENNSPDETILI